MEEKKVRVAVIGIGNIGTAHATAIYEGRVDGMVLSALCDSDKEKAAQLCEQFPSVPVFTDSHSLIESGMVDAVIISTPHYYHPPIAIDAFEHKLHVLSEKPIGVFGLAAKEMVDAATKSGKLFAVMFNQRTNKLFAEARRIVAEGRLGELKRSVWIITNWYRKQAYYDSGSWRATWSGEGGGVLMNQAPHNLDLWQWICGMPIEILARCDVAKFHDIEVEDDVTIYARYKNGATGVFITSTGDLPGTNRLEITGTRGKMVIEGGKLTLTELAVDEREFCTYAQKEKMETRVTEILDEKREGHIEVLKNLAKAILYGEELIAKGAEGLSELEICNAAYLSQWTDRTVSLPIDDKEYFSLLNERIKSSREKASAEKDHHVSTEYLSRWNTNW